MPSRRAVWWWSAAGAALLLGAPGWMVYSAVTAEPVGCGPETAEALMAHQRAAMPGREVAGERVDALVERFKAAEGEWRTQKGREEWLAARLEVLNYGPWPLPEHAFSLEALAFVQPLVDELCEWTDFDRQLWLVEHDGGAPVAVSRHNSGLRGLARALLATMRVSAARRDWIAFERATSAALALATFMGHNPSYVGRIMANGGFSMTLEEIRLSVTECGPPGEVLERLIALVRDHPVAPHPARYWIEGGRLESIGFLGAVYDDAGQEVTWRFDELFGVDSTPGWLKWAQNRSPEIARGVSNVRTLVRPNRAAAERTLNAAFEDLAEWAETPVAERPDSPALSPQARSHRIARFFQLQEETFARNVWLTDWVESYRSGTIALLRVEAHRARAGRLPRSLGEAMHAEEAIDPLTGSPFEYTIDVSDGAAPGYTLRAGRPRAFPVSGPEDNEEVLTLRRRPLRIELFSLPPSPSANDQESGAR